MFVELGYEISHRMPVYPGLPDVEVLKKESLDKGDDWNGTILSIYLHAGTHVDAPRHFINDGPEIGEIPIDRFLYKNPKLIHIPSTARHLITVEELIAAGGDDLYTADILFLNTGYWKNRQNDFAVYQDNYPALSPEAAEFIRNDLLDLKAVAIDTLSIEDLKVGAMNGYKTHRALLDPFASRERTLLVYEDYNPEPILGKKLVSAFVTPLRIKNGEAVPVNIVAEVEE